MMADGSPWWADEGDGVKPDGGELPASEKEASSGPVESPDSWDAVGEPDGPVEKPVEAVKPGPGSQPVSPALSDDWAEVWDEQRTPVEPALTVGDDWGVVWGEPAPVKAEPQSQPAVGSSSVDSTDWADLWDEPASPAPEVQPEDTIEPDPAPQSQVGPEPVTEPAPAEPAAPKADEWADLWDTPADTPEPAPAEDWTSMWGEAETTPISPETAPGIEEPAQPEQEKPPTIPPTVEANPFNLPDRRNQTPTTPEPGLWEDTSVEPVTDMETEFTPETTVEEEKRKERRSVWPIIGITVLCAATLTGGVIGGQAIISKHAEQEQEERKAMEAKAERKRKALSVWSAQKTRALSLVSDAEKSIAKDDPEVKKQVERTRNDAQTTPTTVQAAADSTAALAKDCQALTTARLSATSNLVKQVQDGLAAQVKRAQGLKDAPESDDRKAMLDVASAWDGRSVSESDYAQARSDAGRLKGLCDRVQKAKDEAKRKADGKRKAAEAKPAPAPAPKYTAPAPRYTAPAPRYTAPAPKYTPRRSTPHYQGPSPRQGGGSSGDDGVNIG